MTCESSERGVWGCRGLGSASSWDPCPSPHSFPGVGTCPPMVGSGAGQRVPGCSESPSFLHDAPARAACCEAVEKGKFPPGGSCFSSWESSARNGPACAEREIQCLLMSFLQGERGSAGGDRAWLEPLLGAVSVLELPWEPRGFGTGLARWVLLLLWGTCQAGECRPGRSLGRANQSTFTRSLLVQCLPAVGYCSHLPVNVLGNVRFLEPLHPSEEPLPKVSLCGATSSKSRSPLGSHSRATSGAGSSLEVLGVSSGRCGCGAVMLSLR